MSTTTTVRLGADDAKAIGDPRRHITYGPGGMLGAEVHLQVDGVMFEFADARTLNHFADTVVAAAALGEDVLDDGGDAEAQLAIGAEPEAHAFGATA